jgi:hypothetical protein
MLFKTIKFLEILFLKGWWVALFTLLCYITYEQAIKWRNQEFIKLEQQCRDIQKMKNLSANLHQDLLLQVNSQSDPAWVELVLMKGLGLVPEGKTKVLFKEQR